MQYLSVKEAAKKWGYSESTIRKWCKDDIIKVTFGAEKKNGKGDRTQRQQSAEADLEKQNLRKESAGAKTQ